MTAAVADNNVRYSLFGANDNCPLEIWGSSSLDNPERKNSYQPEDRGSGGLVVTRGKPSVRSAALCLYDKCVPSLLRYLAYSSRRSRYRWVEESEDCRVGREVQHDKANGYLDGGSPRV